MPPRLMADRVCSTMSRYSGDPLPVVLAQEQPEVVRSGELGGFAEPAPARIEAAGQLPGGLVDQLLAGAFSGRVAVRGGLQDIGQLPGGFLDDILFGAPFFGQLPQKVQEARTPEPAGFGEVGAGIKGAAVRGQEHGQGASRPGRSGPGRPACKSGRGPAFLRGPL